MQSINVIKMHMIGSLVRSIVNCSLVEEVLLRVVV